MTPLDHWLTGEWQEHRRLLQRCSGIGKKNIQPGEQYSTRDFKSSSNFFDLNLGFASTRILKTPHLNYRLQCYQRSHHFHRDINFSKTD